MNTPQEGYNAMVAAQEVRVRAPLWQILLQSLMGGAWIALGSFFCMQFQALFIQYGRGPALFVGGVLFPLGLIALVWTGGHLFTGNCLALCPGFMNGTLPRFRVFLVYLINWWGNFGGSAFVVFVIAYSGKWAQTEPLKSWAQEVGKEKMAETFLETYLRGLAANWMVTWAIWNGWVTGKDGGAKFLGIWFPGFALAAMGYEHSIADMFYVFVAQLAGSDISGLDFLVKSLLPATLGNFFSGFFFMGCTMWLTYDPRFKTGYFDRSNGTYVLGIWRKAPPAQQQDASAAEEGRASPPPSLPVLMSGLSVLRVAPKPSSPPASEPLLPPASEPLQRVPELASDTARTGSQEAPLPPARCTRTASQEAPLPPAADWSGTGSGFEPGAAAFDATECRTGTPEAHVMDAADWCGTGSGFEASKEAPLPPVRCTRTAPQEAPLPPAADWSGTGSGFEPGAAAFDATECRTGTPEAHVMDAADWCGTGSGFEASMS